MFLVLSETGGTRKWLDGLLLNDIFLLSRLGGVGEHTWTEEVVLKKSFDDFPICLGGFCFPRGNESGNDRTILSLVVDRVLRHGNESMFFAFFALRGGFLAMEDTNLSI